MSVPKRINKTALANLMVEYFEENEYINEPAWEEAHEDYGIWLASCLDAVFEQLRYARYVENVLNDLWSQFKKQDKEKK